jgi:hypothetical protein
MSGRTSHTCILPAACLAAGLAAGAVMIGCQGDFDPPAFNSPRDPSNNQLPPTPVIDSVRVDNCGNGGLPLAVLYWSILDTTGLQGYQIYRADTSSVDPGDLIAAVSSAQRQFTDGRPLPGLPPLSIKTSYWYRVRALNRDGLPGLRSAPRVAVTDSCTGGPAGLARSVR